MGVTKRVDKVARTKTSDVSQHDCKQGIAGDVERHPEAHVRRALVQLAGKLSIGAIELDLRVFIDILVLGTQVEKNKEQTRQWQGGKAILSKSAGFQAHMRMRRSSGFVLSYDLVKWLAESHHKKVLKPDQVNNISQLVNSLARVVSVHVHILGAEVPPL